ncbi:MAG TPA: family 16 glycoside hydrolase, partial [Candidatus Eisenbacteria bacterium]|nr:family 16 glycoside hydrolase [Candidatus Eisenbacteria bacterium]
IEAGVRQNDWNDITIIAQGNHIVQKINGVVTADLTDENDAVRPKSGLIALKMFFFSQPSKTAQFKNIRLKRFAPTVTPQPKPALATVPSGTNFTSLFNGRDLTGWDGDTNVWSVKDGVINAEVTDPKARRGDLFLVWRAGKVDDFELHVSTRLLNDKAKNNSNLGIKYRAYEPNNGKMGGYLMDFGGLSVNRGALLETEGRFALCRPGQKTIARAGGGRDQVDIVGEVSTSTQLEAAFKPEDWNELTIISQGNHVVQKLNDVVIADMTDENDAVRPKSGLLALKMFFVGHPAKTAQFKDIRLKHL